MGYEIVGYYFEATSDTLCHDCAEAWLRNEGIETDEEIRYILHGADYTQSNTMEKWPRRWQKNNRWHSKGDYVRDRKTQEILFDEDVKVTKQNRPSNFADVPNKNEVMSIDNQHECFDGEYCADCQEELIEPYYFDCEECHEHIAVGEEGWEYQKKVDAEIREKYHTETYSNNYKYYICEQCRTKQNKEQCENLYVGINAIADKEGWTRIKQMYMFNLIRSATHLIPLKEMLLAETKKAVQHGWAKDRYIIPYPYHAEYDADWHSELIELIDLHLTHEVGYDITWNGVARKND